jgi:pimeloyl-ACP methyl ester carboxylesterase
MRFLFVERVYLIIQAYFLLIGQWVYSQEVNVSSNDEDVALPRKKLYEFSSSEKAGIHLPYPIIFIHGLNSSYATWKEMADSLRTILGLSYGGRFDFCLNYDGDDTRANLILAPSAGADIAFFAGNWMGGDYYFVNFDVGKDGSVPPGWGEGVESNQQAIIKQGKALSIAIHKVLSLTHRDKVILFGHSMGGLASREYLQTPAFWQPDGRHHVAKLITTGTPHGGSNASAPYLVALLAGIDTKSDAVRDLRTSYSQTNVPGVFLFGGIEDDSLMDDFIIGGFHNFDVNCNEHLGDHIVGLNQKTLPTDVDYACIIGMCDGCSLGEELPGDGVVNATKANLNTYYPNITQNIFNFPASALTEIHTSLPSLFTMNMRALDEPEQPSLAYQIDFNTIYKAFITRPSPQNTSNPIDVDLFRFYLNSPSTITVVLDDISLSNLRVQILDSALNVVSNTYSSSGQSTLWFNQYLNKGNYFLKVSGKTSSEKSIDTYNFVITKVPTNIHDDFTLQDTDIFPNPVDDVLKVKTTSNAMIEIIHFSGNVVIRHKANSDGVELNVSHLAPGYYFLKINNGETILVKSFIKK